MNKKVSIIVPVFNEHENISPLVAAIHSVFQPTTYHHEIIFVDDGSANSTMSVIKAIQQYDQSVKFISFSKNFGHQPRINFLFVRFFCFQNLIPRISKLLLLLNLPVGTC